MPYIKASTSLKDTEKQKFNHVNNSIPLTVDYIPVKKACQFIMFNPERIEDISPTQRKV